MRLVRRASHDLATPLSGAVLHLELARRQLGSPQGLESVEVVRRQVESAAAMLRSLSEVAIAGDDEPEIFPVPDAVIAGASRGAEGGAAPRLALPPAAPRPTVYGSRPRLEGAVEAMTGWALQDGKRARWTIDEAPDGVRLVCEIPDGLAGPLPTNPDQLFGLGQPGLFAARWAIECLGGTVASTSAPDAFRLVATLPGGGS